MKPNSIPRLSFPLASALAALLAPPALHAATYYWDSNTTAATFGTAQGTWAEPTAGSATQGWTIATNGTTAPDASRSILIADDVNFGLTATTPIALSTGSIAVSGTVNVRNISYGSTSGNITLSAGGTINLGATSVITTSNGAATNTISSILSGAATSLTKAGSGILVLNGANTYTGTTIVNAGTFNLGGGTATGSLASTVLTLGGGALNYTRNDNATQNFTTSNINSGTSSISVLAGNILNLGTVTRGSGVRFDFSSTGAGTLAAAAASNVGGIMPGFTFGESWAVANDANNPISGLASYTLTSVAGTTGANYTGNNIDVNNSAGTLDAAITANSLRFSTAAANTATLSGTSNVITTGGILVGSAVGSNLSTITGGTLAGANTKDLSVIQNNTSGGLTISSVIANNTGATALIKSGAGLLTLGSNNTFTGGLSIYAGKVELGNPGALNSTAGSENAVSFTAGSTGTLALGGNSVVVRSLSHSGGSPIVENANITPATLTIGNSGNAASSWSGVIRDGTGGGALTLAKSGTGKLDLYSANSYTGGTTINAGTIEINNAGSFGGSGIITFAGNGTIQPVHSSNPTLANGLQVNPGVTGTLYVDNQFFSMNYTGPVTGSGTLIQLNGGGGATGTVTLSSAANTFTGILQLAAPNTKTSNLIVNSLADSANPIRFTTSLTGAATGNNFSLGGGTATPLLFNSRQIVLASTTGTAGIYNANAAVANTITINTDLSVTGVGTKTLLLGGANTGANTFAGKIVNGSGTINFTKADGGRWILSNTANTYTGVTTVSAGTLEVAKIDIGGNNSSIGASGAGAANLVFNSGGTLRYTGSADSTDRAFTYNSTSNDTGWTINSSGSGALNFTNTGTITYTGTANQGRFFTLTGTNANDNTFAGTIINNGTGLLNFTKGGTGKWILTGANTYTGGTFIQSGILEVQSGASNLTQTLAGLFTNTGEGTLVANKAGAGNLVINFSSRGRNAGGSANIVSTGGTNGTDNSVNITGAAGFIDKGTYFNGADFAALSGINGFVRALAYGSDTDAEPVGTITASKHIKLATTPGSQAAISLLSLNLAGSGVSWTTTSGNLTVPGIIKSGGGTQSTISGGNVTTTSNAELVIRTDTTADSLLISSPLTQVTGVLTKSGAGTLTLGGVNTYTGATNVNSGKLLITGTNANNSATTVKSGATLGGTGTLGGSVTVQADAKLEFNLSTAPGGHDKLDLAASRTLTFSGASVLTITSSGGATTGNYTLLTAPGGITITNSVLPTVNLPGGWTGSVSVVGNDLVLNVTSVGGGGPGPVDNFLISTISSPQTVGTPITGITLTARDNLNNTATSFTGTVTFGGTGGFSGTSATFTSGVLSGVSVTPTLAGSNLTFTVNDGASHTGSATITTIQTQYEAWASGALFGADANNDGVDNGMAWVLGATDKDANAIGLLPTFDNTTDPDFFIFTYRRDDDANTDPNTTIKAEYGSTLAGWTPAVAGVDIIITPTNDGAGVGVDSVQVKIRRTLAVGGKLFARLNAVKVP